MHFAKLIIAFTLFAAVIGAAHAESKFDVSRAIDSTKGALGGRLTRRSDGKSMPIVGAMVSLTGTSFGALSDEEGKFELFRVPTGTYDLRIMHMDYETKVIRNVQVLAGSKTNTDVALRSKPNISLEENYDFNPRHLPRCLIADITDSATGEPVSGAIVTIRGTYFTNVTDGDGWGIICQDSSGPSLPAGKVTVVITHPNYKPVRLRWVQLSFWGWNSCRAKLVRKEE